MKVFVYYQIYTALTFYNNFGCRGNQSYLRNIQEAFYRKGFKRKLVKKKGNNKKEEKG